MQISVTLPGQAATGRDKYRHVDIEPEGSPLRYRFSYAVVVHEDGHYEAACLESGLIQRFKDPDEADPDNLAQATTAAVRDFSENWKRYEHAARATLKSAMGEESFSARPRERRVLSDEFLADIVAALRAAERKGLQGTATVARQERVGTSTVRNWLAKARERGIEGANEDR